MAGGLTVGELAVELEARTREFNRRMQDAERRVGIFERKTEQSTKAAGGSFRNLAGPIAAVGGALAALGAAKILKDIGSAAVSSAAQFESYEVRLKALLGSQEGANRALEGFVELSTKTPFAVEQIVSGATTLASVANGSREELDELTKTSANLAAVTGLSFDQAAGNLQRALASGIGAADLFRERGVRKIIEDVNGIPDLTKVPLDEQRELFKATFGPDALTPFATAAEDLSKTLGGSLSNIGDAASNAQRSLGEALSPAVFATAKAVVIPFFESVKNALDENQEAITDFAARGITGLIRGFARALQAGADVLELLSALGIDLGDIGDIIRVLREAFGIFFEAVRLGFNTIISGVALLAEGIGKVGNALGLISDDDVRRLEQFRTESFEKLAADAEEFGGKAEEALFQSALAIRDLADDGDEFAEVLRQAGEAAGVGADELERQVAAFREMRREAKAARDEAAAGPLGAAARGGIDIAAITEGGARFLETGTTAEEINAEFEEIDAEWERLQAKWAEEGAPGLGETFGAALNEGILALAEGEGVQGFAEALAGTSGDLLSEAINGVLGALGEGLSEILGGLSESLGGIFEGLGGGGGGGGGLFGGGGGGGGGFGAALGAGLSIGGQLLSRQLEGTTARVTNDLVESAVTSTQQVRGLVAGPTSIPIAEVGNAIRDAQAGQIAELRRGNALLQAILDAIRSAEPGALDPAQAFADVIASEMGGSVALG